MNPRRSRFDPPTLAHFATAVGVALLVAPQILLAVALAAHDPQDCRDLGALAWTQWFDPMYVSYNLALASIAVLAVPGITIFYVTTMKDEKLRRLRNDMSDEHWKTNEAALSQHVDRQFRLGNYVGSLTTLTLIVLLGAAIILMLKPVPSPDQPFGCGVDYSRGANFLTLGPYIELFGLDPKAYYHHVLISLTAFQFGFLGAYVYLISDVVRAYFTLDLSSRTFVMSTIRLVAGSLLALVLSFLTAHPFDALDAALPAIAFFLGHFPERALRYLERTVSARLRIDADKFKSMPLSALPGMSYAHETRLAREGFDNVQNLANARPFDIVLNTGFSYRQTRQWIAQAWLCMHLGEEHYDDFRAGTGITSADELAQFIDAAPAHDIDPEAHLAEATGRRYPHKIRVLRTLVVGWRERMERPYIAA